jgi:hypothetical protein
MRYAMVTVLLLLFIRRRPLRVLLGGHYARPLEDSETSAACGACEDDSGMEEADPQEARP